MTGGPFGPVNCRIRHRDDGTVSCETHGVDFGATFPQEGPGSIRQHIFEANEEWHRQQDLLERAARSVVEDMVEDIKGSLPEELPKIIEQPGAPAGAMSLFQQIAGGILGGLEESRKLDEARKDRIAKALERIAHAMEERARIFVACPDCGSRLVVRHDGEVSRHELSE